MMIATEFLISYRFGSTAKTRTVAIWGVGSTNMEALMSAVRTVDELAELAHEASGEHLWLDKIDTLQHFDALRSSELEDESLE